VYRVSDDDVEEDDEEHKRFLDKKFETNLIGDKTRLSDEKNEFRLSISRKIESAAKMKEQMSQKQLMDKETSLFCPCLRVRRGFKLQVVTAILVLAVFTERYCFYVSVYKTKFFGYLLILLVSLLNMIVQAL
jgi:hypothetical protein